MALPSRTDLSTLDYVYQGAPFVQVEAKALATESLDVVYQAMPFFGVGSLFNVNLWIKLSGVWKKANALYYNKNGTWKTVTSVSVKIAGNWVD